MSTNNILGCFFVMKDVLENQNRGESYEEYRKCGLEVPQIIYENKSILLKNIENGEGLYKGHFVIWTEIYMEPKGTFMRIIGVFVIDEK